MPARLKTPTHLLLLLLFLALAGCKNGELPPPEATPEQIAREQAFVLANFRSNPCFITALERARTLEQRPAKSPSYSVTLPASVLTNDDFHYNVTVRKNDRMATITRQGGYFGGYQILGPVPLSSCLQPVFGVPS